MKNKFLVEIEGNLEFYAQNVPMTKYVEYDKFLNKTFIIVDAPEKKYMENVRLHYYNIHADILAQEKKYKKKQIQIKYFA